MTILRRYLATIVLSLLAVVLLGAGGLSVTTWKPAQQVVATGTTDAPFLVTRLGLFGLYGDGDSVKLTATAADPSEEVWVVMGSQSDVAAWLEGHSYEEIYGLVDLQTLKMEPHLQPVESPQSGEEVKAEEPQSGAISVNPMASDMWLLEKSNVGSLQMNISGERMDQVLIAATDGTDPAPSLTLEWDTPVINYAAIFLFSFAALFALLALFSWLLVWRAQRRRAAIRRRMEERVQADTTATTMIPVIEASEEVEESGGEEDSVELTEEVEVREEPVLEPQQVEEDTILEAEASEEFAPDPAEQEEAQQESPAEPVDEDPAPAEPQFLDRTQELTTESGMINLTALKGGAKFPTRRALREAQARGVDKFVIEGVEFSTESRPSPARDSSETAQSETTALLGKRSSRSSRWSTAFGQPEPGKDDDEQ